MLRDKVNHNNFYRLKMTLHLEGTNIKYFQKVILIVIVNKWINVLKWTEYPKNFVQDQPRPFLP